MVAKATTVHIYKNHRLVRFKWVKGTECEFKLQKASEEKEVPVLWLAHMGDHLPHVLGMRGGFLARAQVVLQRAEAEGPKR